MLSRRQAFLPLTAALTAPSLQTRGDTQKPPAAPTLPDRYDQPLGIGLEGWPYPAPVRWHACSANGQNLRMAYMDIAPVAKNRGKTVVLLHGKNFDSSYWAGPIKDLADAGFRVIVPDQIGFNKSSKPDMTYTLDTLAELTINLLRGQVVGQASFIGHSFGSMLAIRIAATYPKQVERLVLEGPLGLVDYRRYVPPQSLDTLVAAERRRTAAAYRGFIRHFFTTLPAKDTESFVEWRLRVAQSGEYERFCRATALTYQMIYQDEVRDQLEEILAPCLMIIGDKDEGAPLKQYAAPEMAAKMPSIPEVAPNAIKALKKGSLFVMPNVGHVPHLEAPDAFRNVVTGFLTT